MTRSLILFVAVTVLTVTIYQFFGSTPTPAAQTNQDALGEKVSFFFCADSDGNEENLVHLENVLKKYLANGDDAAFTVAQALVESGECSYEESLNFWNYDIPEEYAEFALTTECIYSSSLGTCVGIQRAYVEHDDGTMKKGYMLIQPPREGAQSSKLMELPERIIYDKN